jgi:hypothetical protein
MVEITEISTMVAVVGVLVGVFLAVLELRDLVKQRQTELVNDLYSFVRTREYLEAWKKFTAREITTDFHEYEKKYGLEGSVEMSMVLNLMDQVGVLLRRKLIDFGIVQDLFGPTVIATWEKVKPLFDEETKRTGRPHVYPALEYLYNEVKERERRLQVNKS